MRNILSLFLSIGLVLVAFSTAAAQVRSDIAAERAELQSNRQAIVAENLPLTEGEAKAFWPAYREYRGEMQKLGDRLVELFLDYAKNSESLSDSQATAMLDSYLAVQKDEAKIKSDWVPKFRKILPPKVVTRFYQIDNKLDAILRFDAVDRIPLVRIGRK